MGVAGEARAGEVIKIGTLAPGASPWGQVFKVWAEAVSKRSNGAVQLEFSSGGGATFKLNGGITGTMTCVDASVGQIIAGTFQVREGLGTFSFNNCP